MSRAIKLSDWKTLTKQEKIEIIRFDSENWKQLHDNLYILDEFIKELEFEFRHYRQSSARYIVEKLRRRSHLRDNSVLFKISNYLTPKINHFVLDVFPELRGFLKRRG